MAEAIRVAERERGALKLDRVLREFSGEVEAEEEKEGDPEEEAVKDALGLAAEL